MGLLILTGYVDMFTGTGNWICSQFCNVLRHAVFKNESVPLLEWLESNYQIPIPNLHGLKRRTFFFLISP